ARLDHGAGAAIAQRGRCLEALLHLAERGHQALLLQRVEYLPHLVGALAGLVHQAHARLGDLHLLGAHAHEREVGADQDFARAHMGQRYLAHVARTVPQVLADLLHGRFVPLEGRPMPGCVSLAALAPDAQRGSEASEDADEAEPILAVPAWARKPPAREGLRPRGPCMRDRGTDAPARARCAAAARADTARLRTPA